MRRTESRAFCVLLAVLLLALPLSTDGFALFREDDTPASVAAEFGWDADSLDGDGWDVFYTAEDLAGTDAALFHPDGFAVRIPRASQYGAEYFSDLVETASAYLGLGEDGLSGADIAALAVSEYEACEQEVREGRTGERRETGRDNCTMYTRYWGLNAPWCAMFICWLADRCGYLDGSTFPDHVIYRCGVGRGGFLQWFRDNGNRICRIRETKPFGGSYAPVPGDILIFGRAPGGHDHIGIVTEADGQKIVTVEGNVRDRVMRIEYRAGTLASWGWADAYVIHVEYPLSAGTGGLSREDAASLWDSMAVPTKDAVFRLARERYGYDESAVEAMFAYVGGESGGYYASQRGDPYIEYLYGSIAVNQMSLYRDGESFLRWIHSWAPDGYYSWSRLRSRARYPNAATRKAVYLALLNPHPEAYYGYGTGTAPVRYIYTFTDAAGDRIWIRPRDTG